MIVRQATSDDYPVWAAMLARLHADQSAEEFDRELADSLHEPYVGFLAFNEDGEPAGMIDATIRSYAEGAPNLRAAYVEDLWVEPGYRRGGRRTCITGRRRALGARLRGQGVALRFGLPCTQGKHESKVDS